MSTTAPEPRGRGVPMRKLSSRVYLLRPVPSISAPSAKGEPRASDDPELIIIFGWMNATPKGPLAKYVNQYQTLFPNSSILLVTCTFAGISLPWLGLREARKAAIATHAILAQQYQAKSKTPTRTSDRGRSKPRLLLHVFSNAGSTMLYHFYIAYAEQAKVGSSSSAATEEVTLPPHITVFDSCPAAFTYQTLLQGILDGAGPSNLMRLLITPVAYIYVVLIWLLVTVLRLPDHIGDLAPRAHNDPARVGDEVLRVYMYGNGDRITPWQGVERHARQAGAYGFEVRREVFERSAHVAHARFHPDRYWDVVRKTWEDGFKM
ncbi:putative indole-diterpene biosynthesis protein [Rhypophila sp. PSN 637]